MKKIFILTGEPSGDKLASNLIRSLNDKKKDIEYLGVCGNNLKSLGIKSIYDQKDITYMAFTDVVLNFLKIKKKIDFTVNEVIKFNPSILFTVDSPDFSLRVSEKVKQINPKIKTIPTSGLVRPISVAEIINNKNLEFKLKNLFCYLRLN